MRGLQDQCRQLNALDRGKPLELIRAVRLSGGERSCLDAVVCRQGLLASDGLHARRIARQQNVPLTGTVGILVLSVRRGSLSREEASGLLAEMVALG